MPIFGITASSNMSTKLTDFYQIATTTLGSAQSSITFSSIPQDYTHLQIRAIARTTIVGTDENVYLRFNSDSSTLYAYHFLYGTGSAAASGATLNEPYLISLRGTGNSSSANMFGSGVVDILDYTNTNKFKTVRSITGHDQNGSGTVWLFSGLWRSTSAVTSITLLPSSANLAQYSSFALYGIKG